MLENVIKEVLGSYPRKQQFEIFNNFNAAINSQSVALIEADTGIGKTLSTLSSAIEWLSKNAGRVVVSVPTKVLAQQFLEESKKASFTKGIVKVICSKGDFVSVSGLMQVATFESLETQNAILSWLKSQELEAEPYLLANLESSLPSFNLTKLCSLLESDENDADPGYLAYRKQFEKSTSYRLIICTHAMLAYDLNIRRKNDISLMRSTGGGFDVEKIKALSETDDFDNYSQASNSFILDSLAESEIKSSLFLPKYNVVFVDEAHLFEKSVATVLSPKCSFWKLEYSLNNLNFTGSKKLVNQSLLGVKDVMFNVFSSLETSNQISFLSLEKGFSALSKDVYSKAHGLLEVVGSLKFSKKERGTSSFKTFSMHTEALKNFISSIKRGSQTVINFSPEKKFASVSSMSQSTRTLIDYMYQTVDSVIYLSATLTFPEQNGKSDYEKMTYLLSIPKQRLLTFPPVRSDFIHKGVKLDFDSSPHFMPVNNDGTSSYEEKLSKWGASVAQRILQEQLLSAGAVLVLNTSYKAISVISDYIKCEVDFIAAKDGYSLNQQKLDFLKLCAEGKRPIWLAIGGAWTGLDVSGKDLGLSANNDNVVTTLIIPRLPLGLNRTLLNRGNISGFNLFDQTFEAYQMLRQGLGRLIRREGLPHNRRIVVLDPRINNGIPQYLYGTLRKAFSVYQPNKPSKSKRMPVKKPIKIA